MTNIILSILLLFFMLPASSQFLKDVNFEKLASENNMQDIDLQPFGFSTDDGIPNSHSLEKYSIVSRQEGMSCVGFAIATGALSISYNQAKGYTSTNHKWQNRFDPYYIYTSIKDSEDLQCLSSGSCGCGTYIKDALEIVKNYGCKKVNLGNVLECSNTLTRGQLRQMMDATVYYSISDFKNLFTYEKINNKWYSDIEIDHIKKWISYNNPVVASIKVDDHFDRVSSTNPLYSFGKGKVGYHAVTIVGYSDFKYGGAFRILNSYGVDWGDQGYFWMSYDDFEKQGNSAYVMMQDDNDWSSWTKIISTSNFYRGFSKSKELHWEGPINKEDRLFNGRGILTTSEYVAAAGYKNGQRHGWWLVLENNNTNNPWNGWILYQDGQYVEERSLGFSSSTITSVEELKKAFHLEHTDMKISSELMTEEELLPSLISGFEKGLAK